MATWVTHFRIAEELLKLGLEVSRKEFVVGNIGPDCGLPTENGFFPPKEITHFKTNGKIDAELFFETYLRDIKSLDSKKYSFYLGYYFHLVTDQEWVKLLRKKEQEPAYQEILGTPKYAKLVKTDWYGLDFVYLKEQPDSIFWNTFQYITEFPDYMDIFEVGQVTKQILRITKFYQESEISSDHVFKYLFMDEVDAFVENTTEILHEILGNKMLVRN